MNINANYLKVHGWVSLLQFTGYSRNVSLCHERWEPRRFWELNHFGFWKFAIKTVPFYKFRPKSVRKKQKYILRAVIIWWLILFAPGAFHDFAIKRKEIVLADKMETVGTLWFFRLDFLNGFIFECALTKQGIMKVLKLVLRSARFQCLHKLPKTH